MARSRGRMATVLLLAGAAALVVLVIAVPLARTPSGTPSASSVVVGGSPLLDKPLPELVLSDLDGRTVRTSDLRGRPLILNIWASWCVPERSACATSYGAAATGGSTPKILSLKGSIPIAAIPCTSGIY